MSATDEDEVNLECFGYFQDKIVGIQYYQGEVNKNEMVTLTREPDNRYDRWAIRVDNVRGVMVGHLPAKLVCHLAPLVDVGLLHLEGLVPRGNNNVYSMPVHLYCFGEPERRGAVISRMRGAGLALMDPHTAPSSARSPLAAGSGGGGGGASGAGAGRAGRLSARELEDSLDRLFKEMLDKTGPRELLDPDPEVTTQLFPHQKEALAWMSKRENCNSLPPFWEPRPGPTGGLTYVSQLTNFISPTRPAPLRGGILADDMGLGKTLEVIALVATNRPGVKYSQLKYYLEEDQPAEEEEEDGEERPAKRQRKGKQAAQKKKTKKEAQPKEPKTKAGKLAAEAAALAAAQEAPPTLPTASGPRGTLIVCPLSVLSAWQMQLEEHTRGSLQVCVYYGQDRDRRVSSLASHDVVLTTYNILAQEAGLKNGPLNVDWLRVVLDEAHTIKNAKTQTAKAAQGLRAERRWAITGTPIQNSLQDLHGLTAFLQLEPLHDKNLFLRTIERLIKSGDPMGLLRLKVLLNTVALRRTKDQRVNGQPLVQLPPRTVHVVTVQLSREERQKYERWEEAGQRVVQRHLSSDTLLQNYTAVLEIILRLRQICDHAALCPGEDPVFAAEAAAGQALTPEVTEMLIQLLKSGLDDDCPICLSEMTLPCITVCKHIFCKRCIETVIARDKTSCPMCRAPISAAGLVELPEEEPPTQTQQQGDGGDGSPQKGGLPGQAGAGASSSSSKIAELLKRLKEAAEEGGGSGGCGGAAEGGERPIKSVVFSQFTAMLDLLEPVLAAEGITYVRLDGSTSAKKRGELLRSFHSHAPGSPQVLIASLKAGGVGLNLTSASRVHLLDPWWNPSVEDQAMDRVHRLGQTRPVEVYRYACEDSIEERMIELQEQKRQLMKAAFERKREEDVRQMRINDVRLLMQL